MLLAPQHDIRVLVLQCSEIGRMANTKTIHEGFFVYLCRTLYTYSNTSLTLMSMITSTLIQKLLAQITVAVVTVASSGIVRTYGCTRVCR